MKLVTSKGNGGSEGRLIVYRLTDPKYLLLLKLIASGKKWDLEALGTVIGVIATDVTDITSEHAQEILEGLNHE